MEAAEQQALDRRERLNEVGREPPCPFCKRPRVSRSDYIRCNPCGVNWLNEEMHLHNYLSLDPRTARRVAALMGNGTKPTADSLAEGVKA
jgi:ribosomal protein L37AE/L43A